MQKNQPEGVALVTESELFGFFHERVEQVVQKQGAPVSEPTVYYLSQLLVDQSRVMGEDATLVELRQRALVARPHEAVSLWKHLGDYALLISGFFRESLRRRQVSPDYYAQMGAGAYQTLRRLLWQPEGGFVEIFSELSQRFHACVDVLGEVREEVRERSDDDVVRLYEEWLQTGSPRIAERLRQLGVLPVRVRGAG